jgi:Ca2+-binding EF-hand superfamily protein
VISHDINFSFFSFASFTRKELKEAFRLYDKEGEKDIEMNKKKEPFWGLINLSVLCLSGNGYIPTSSLREILAALDDQLTSDQLNGNVALLGQC